MFCLRRANPVFNLLKVPASPRSLVSSLRKPVSITTLSLPRCSLSTATDLCNDLFNYTSGRWVYNDVLRHEERRLTFNVDELCRLAAESINQSPPDVVSISKLAEGGFNRTFIIALRDGAQKVARIPYPMTVPKYCAVASEAATIEYLRSFGMPVPKIYGYSPGSDNATGTAYILMEFVQGSKLSEVWRSLDDQEVISVVRQLTQLESKIMTLSFPAGGSLFFTKDLEKVAQELGIPPEDKRFCVGPDVRLPLWYGRRAQLEVNRGPCTSFSAVPFTWRSLDNQSCRCGVRGGPPLPSYHVESLERYLSITSSLVPSDLSLSRFCMRHPDLQYNNIIVSRSPDSDCKVIGLIGWQHASILPMFINYDDSNLDELNEAERVHEEYLYRCHLVHYHYVTSTKECNQLHYAAFTDPLYALRGRLFQEAGTPWEGETHNLKTALIQAAKKWEKLTGGGVPCPEELAQAERGFEFLQSMCDVGEEGWVLPEDYDSAVVFLKDRKEAAFAGAESEEDREEIMTQWPWDDMDEEKYM
ncbi:kinase-like domain-containing protein [Rhodocollybia butyracea]|uniref:Kinase-like domain-containing protein n=1 Tax=Rhodocollybia butyracea TaxID=206335 RepID=A0A9P5UEA4_9AGAR|nr:kinase-like domain-containing protein [Rhodocollybia butyracea]